jgi:hypothetical protein
VGSPGVLPPDFADKLSRLIAPGEEDEVALVLARAAELDYERLAAFLQRFADRVRRSDAALTAADLWALLDSRAPG